MAPRILLIDTIQSTGKFDFMKTTPLVDKLCSVHKQVVITHVLGRQNRKTGTLVAAYPAM